MQKGTVFGNGWQRLKNTVRDVQYQLALDGICCNML